MRLKKWYFAGLVSVIVGSLLFSGIQSSRAEPEPSANSGQEEFRTWTDRSGTYHLDAVLVEFKDGKVTLKKKDGTTLKVLLQDLIDADRQYVKTFATGTTGETEDLSPSAGAQPNSSNTGGGDGVTGDGDRLRTDARESVSAHPGARTSCRTTARTTARTTVGSSSDRGARRVEVDGVGATADEALKDCCRKAVAVVVGTIIDAETDVENDRLVRDRILTFSDGFVESYEELEEAHVEDGLVHRRISATVRRDSLLVACGRAESMSVDASGLYPEAMTKLERFKNARALLRRTLDLLPEHFVQVELAGRPPIEKFGDETTTLAPEVIIRVDAKKYDAVQDRLVQVLRCLSKRQGSVSAVMPQLPRAWQAEARQILRNQFLRGGSDQISVVDADFGPVQALIMKKVAGLSHDVAPEARAVVLIKQPADWMWFILDNNIELPPLSSTVAVAFRNADGGPVKTATFTVGPWAPGLAAPPDDEARGAVRTVFVSPYFQYYAGEGFRIPKIIVARSLTVHGQVTIANQELSQVKTVDVAIRRSP